MGIYEIRPRSNRVLVASTEIPVEPQIMDVLIILAARAGEVVLREEFMRQLWPSRDASDESLTGAISILRKTFASHDPDTTYIQTVPKRGYRLLADVEKPLPDQQVVSSGAETDVSVHADARQLFLQGHSLVERSFGEGVLATAALLLEQAVVLDPGFAQAHSELGHAYSLMSTYTRHDDKRGLARKAARSSETALALDPGMGFPLTIIAMEKFSLGDMVGALQLTEEACRREPENAEVLMRHGYFSTAIGRVRYALPYLEKAVALNPVQGRNLQILAVARLSNGDLNEAETISKRAIDLQHHFAYETYAATAFAMGRHEVAAQRFIDSHRYMTGAFDDRIENRAMWEIAAREGFGPDPAVRKALGEKIRLLMHVPGVLPDTSLTYAMLRTGSAEGYFDVIGDTPPPGMHGSLLSLWGDTEPCRVIYTHPKFMAFAERIGMVDAWRRYGRPDRLP